MTIDENPPSKKTKFIDTWFSKSSVESSCSNVVDKPSIYAQCSHPVVDVQSVPLVPSLNQPDYLNAFERDPGKRCAIWKYPVNKQDYVRRAYVSLKPFKPKKISYPFSLHGDQQRRFQASWLTDYPWLEYSVHLDSAYCFPCFLFDTQDSPQTPFTSVGFRNWKKVNNGLQDNAFVKHVGCIQSPHMDAMQKWNILLNPTKQIETVFLSKSTKDVEDNRLRLKAAIESVRLLANQGAPFRGHDESEESLNSGYFKEVIKSFARMSEEVDRVVKDAPGNAKYISPKIQKEILSILANQVRNKIREEVGDSKYCILVDEAVDISSKEQMAIILRFVDGHGFLRERFFKIVSVPNTSSQTLKNEISKVLTMYDLQVSNMRGQGYDGASNMSGIYKGLQALFLEECPYAYYVHCFAHRLQLTLNATAKGVDDIWDFFSTLNLIVNFVDSSAKRHSALKEKREEEIANLVACGSLQSGSGANQVRTLQRPCATRWSSHYRSISTLIELFSSTKKTLCDMIMQASSDLRAEAKGVTRALRSYDFVFCLLLMHKVMKITEVLCQALQRRSIDFVHALQLVGNTKTLLQEFRTKGWPSLLSYVEAFCIQHDIDFPDMGARYKDGTGRECQQKDIITVEHHYRVDVFNALVDLQLSELGRRFSDQTSELLILSSTLDPRGNFQNFTSAGVCNLAKKFYPEDFIGGDMCALEGESPFYEINLRNDPKFSNLETISDLCQVLAQTKKSITLFPMIYRLICLVMTLPVSTATTERAFSAMNIIKNKLRNKMEDEFLGDCMVLHIEKEYAESIDNNQVIKDFVSLGNRRVKFS